MCILMISMFTNIVIIKKSNQKYLKKLEKFYFMQQQNNYSKLRYSNSVYNKAARRGYQRAAKVPVGSSIFLEKFENFVPNYLFFFRDEKIKSIFSRMICEMLPVLPVLVLSGHDSTVPDPSPDLGKHFINENEWGTWT